MKRITSLQSVATLAVAALMTQLASAQPKWAGTPPPPREFQPDAHVKQDPAQPAGPAGTLTPTGITPAQIQQFYGFNQLNGIDGTGQTIAIIDAYGDRYATVTATTNLVGHKQVITYTTNITDATQNDWTTFCDQFGLVTSGLTVVYPQGQGIVSTNWALETALDIQWAHAIAPGANIMLVVTRDNSLSNLFAAVDYAGSAGANIVSMSWGGTESTNDFAYNALFNKPGVTSVACSGDGGKLPSGLWYPAASPYVLSVGGTQLTNFNGVWSESTWTGSVGGISLYQTMPVYQDGWQQFFTGNMRSVPDVCYQAGPSPGVSVYVTPYGGWIQVYGTSVGAPQWAALIALANSARTLGPLGEAAPAVYSLAGTGATPPNMNGSYFNDMTTGSNGSAPDDAAIPGYDFVTGLGSPVANNLVPALSSWVQPPDFSLTVNPFAATLPTSGGTANYTVSINRLAGFAEGINLSVGASPALPSGASAVFDPNPATGNSSDLAISAPANTPAGTYSLTISGVGSVLGLTRTAVANLVVSSMSVASITYAVSGGNKHTPGTLQVTVALKNNLGQPVAGASVSIELYLNGSPYGSVNGTTLSNGTVTLSSVSAPLGTYITTVTSVTASGLTWDGITPSNSYAKTQ